MGQTLDELNRTKGNVVDDFKTVVEDAEAMLHATAQVSGEKLAAEREKFGEKLRHAKIRLAEAEQRVVAKAKQAATATDHYVHDNPWQAVGVAAAVGMLIGFLAARR